MATLRMWALFCLAAVGSSAFAAGRPETCAKKQYESIELAKDHSVPVKIDGHPGFMALNLSGASQELAPPPL